MKKNSDVKVTAETQSPSVIRLAMVFNTVSSDGLTVNYESEAFVPVGNRAADEKMCRGLETAITPFAKDLVGLFSYVSSIRTGAQLEEMNTNPQSHQPNPRELAEITARASNLQDGIVDLLDRVMDTMGPHFVNKTNINFDTKCKIAPK